MRRTEQCAVDWDQSLLASFRRAHWATVPCEIRQRLSLLQGAVMANKTVSPRSFKVVPEVEGNPVRNELLLGLPTQESDVIFPQLTFVQLRTHDVLEESEEPIKYGYFVDSGLVSVLSMMEGGKSVEVGISGKEGCTALPMAVGLKTSAARIVVQIAGTAFRVASP